MSLVRDLVDRDAEERCSDEERIIKWRGFHVRSLIIDAKDSHGQLQGTVCVQLPIAHDITKAHFSDAQCHNSIGGGTGHVTCILPQLCVAALPALGTHDNDKIMLWHHSLLRAKGEDTDSFWELRSTLCDLFNNAFSYRILSPKARENNMRYLFTVSSARVSVTLVVRSIREYRGEEDVSHPSHMALDIAFCASPLPHMGEHNMRAVHHLRELEEYCGCRTAITYDTDEVVLLIAEELELNSHTVRGTSLSNQRLPGSTRAIPGLKESFLVRITRADQARIMDYRRKLPGLMRSTPLLSQIQTYRMVVGWAPSDSYFSCAACGLLLKDAAKATVCRCHKCYAIGFCSVACAAQILPHHTEFCFFVDPTQAQRQTSCPTIGFYQLGEKLRQTEDERAQVTTQVDRLLDAISTYRHGDDAAINAENADFSRIAIGGSFAQRTAMVYDYDVDLVFMFRDWDVLKQIPKVLRELEELLRAVGAEITRGPSKSIACVFYDVKFDILVGIDMGDTVPDQVGQKPSVENVMAQQSKLMAQTAILPCQDIPSVHCSFTEGCVLFMARQPDVVLRTIRIIKFMQMCEKAKRAEHATYETLFQKAKPALRFLPSYATSLVVVHCYRTFERQGATAECLLREYLHFISRLARGMGQTVIHFDEFYSWDEWRQSEHPAINSMLQTASPLVIVDPVSPFVDVVSTFRMWKPLFEFTWRMLAALYSAPDPLEVMFRLSTFGRLRNRVLSHGHDARESAVDWQAARPADAEGAQVQNEAYATQQRLFTLLRSDAFQCTDDPGVRLGLVPRPATSAPACSR